MKQNRAIHPGEFLLDALEDLELSCDELAEMLERPSASMERVLKGRARITKPLARDLEMAISTPARIWLNLQESYDEAIGRLSADPLVREDISLLDEIPWREFRRAGWIRDPGTDVERVGELRTLYDVETLCGIENSKHAAAFRISKGTDFNAWAVAAWVQEGVWQTLDRQMAEDYGVFPSFDKEKFKESLPQFRSLTLSESFWPEMRRLCAEVGVALEFVPNVKKSGANGVTYWTEPTSPVIQLSLFRKRADIFWFTFFHEAGHLLLHEGDDFFINLDEKQRTDDKELEADRFAADTLIAPAEYQHFTTVGSFSHHSIVDFAKSVDVHPGIVVGRLHHEGLLRRDFRNDLRFSLTESMFVD